MNRSDRLLIAKLEKQAKRMEKYKPKFNDTLGNLIKKLSKSSNIKQEFDRLKSLNMYSIDNLNNAYEKVKEFRRKKRQGEL